MNRKYSLLPRVTLRNYMQFKKLDWDAIDTRIKEKLGLEGLAIPSIRVGICWVLEYLGYTRRQNHIFVPKYLSRCILNAINRYAFPVEKLTSQTSLALVVNQFGFQQNLGAIVKETAARNMLYIEDNANGVSSKEVVGQNSYSKLIGFSKLLPILKGGVLISPNKDLANFVRIKRRETKPTWYSWFIFMVLALERKKKEKIEYSALVDLAYESYLQSPRDNRLLLNNFWLGLDMVDTYVEITHKKIELVKKKLGKRVIYPDADELVHVLLFLPENKGCEIKEIFDRNNFDSTLYHFDMHRNIFNSEYKKVFLIPLNPTIPMKKFDVLIEELSLIKN